MKRNIIISAIVMMITTGSLQSQDHHFSQFDATLQYLNPALTGMSWEGPFDWRANSSCRSQWGSIASRPFTNQLLAFDMPFKKEYGLGGYIVNNSAGSGHLNTLNFMLGGAYEITVDPSEVHNLYVGAQLGLLHRSVRVSELFFDSQYSYSTGTYDAGISSGENIPDKSIVRFDANFGFYYVYNEKNNTLKPHGGLSLFHVVMPNESLTGLKTRMPIRWIFTAGTEYIINEQFKLMPDFMVQWEAKAVDFVIGTLAGYLIKDTEYRVLSGFSYRNKDAVIIHLGLNHKRCWYRMSYDLNTSYLKAYTKMKGGLEFSVIYLFQGKEEVGRTFI